MADAALALDPPVWDLSDLYRGMDDPAITDDLAVLAKDTAAFETRFKSKLAELDSAGLAAALKGYEGLEDRISRILSYAQLENAADAVSETVSQFYQSIQEKTTDLYNNLLFFGLELNEIDDETLARQLAGAEAGRYRSWIERQRAFKPYQLSEEMETLLQMKQISGRNSWVRLYDETLAAMQFDVDGKQLNLEGALNLLSDSDGAVRKRAAKSLSNGFDSNLRLLTLITNTLAKDKEIEDNTRALPEPETGRHLANHVEAEVVDALQDAVEAVYPRLAHRYYAFKAKWMGLDKLNYWDRNAPLPDADDSLIAWQDARDLVLDAYGRFAPEMANLGKRFFDKPWIDAAMRPGKSAGAFSHPTVCSAHPYIMMNYQGRTRDVMTLAHELGHGVHQLLAAKQGGLLAATPLTLAETASVFGEQLTFRALLANESDSKRQRLLIASKVEDMLNTVVRQIAFYSFERRIHRARRNGELDAGQIGEIWMDVQGKSLGPAITLTPDYANYWCYIPHFIHTPFYVYAYAFGDCLVNSLYAVYEQSDAGFQQKYMTMLSAGGSQSYDELLAPFGLNPRDPSFWQQGLSVISGLIDQLEQE